jgi:uncharacterized membrane protein
MTTAIGSETRQFQQFEIRRVPLRQPLEWLGRGWDDLRELRGASLAHGALIAILGAVLLMVGSSYLYFIAAAITGYLLVGPIMTTGVCELSRRREAGEPVGFDESLTAVTRHPRALLQFGVLLAAITVVWFGASEVILQSVAHTQGPNLAEKLWGGFADTASRGQIVAYIGSGAILAAIVFTVSVVAVPLIIHRHASATEAMWASLKATFWNLPAMLVWSALIIALTVFGFLTLLVGMVFVAPLLGHATWHAYRDLVG